MQISVFSRVKDMQAVLLVLMKLEDCSVFGNFVITLIYAAGNLLELHEHPFHGYLDGSVLFILSSFCVL